MDNQRRTSHTAPGSIVVGIDGSPGSDRALAWATERARLEHRPLTLVHVVNNQALLWAGEAPFDAGGVLAAMKDEGRALLATAEAPLGELDGVAVATILAVGDPHQALMNLAREASMLIVGSRGRGPVASLLLGSVSAGVSQHATCPVVVVRPEEDDNEKSAAGVVVGLRVGRPIGPTLEFAFRQASLASLPLTVVHGRGEELFGYAGPAIVDTDENVLAEDLGAAAAQLEELREKFPEVVVSYAPARGLPDSRLLEVAAGSGLIVVGTSDPYALTTLLEGNVARSVVEHAHCPVAVVPET